MPRTTADGSPDSRVSLEEIAELARAASRAGAHDEALRMAEAGLARVPREGSARHAAQLLLQIGVIRAERSELELADEVLEVALVVATAQGFAEASVEALIALGGVAVGAGRLDRADDRFRSALQRATAAGQQSLVARVHHNRGVVANIRGDSDAALADSHAALSAYRRAGDAHNALRCLLNLGVVHRDREEWELAERCYDEALAGMGAESPAELALLHLNRAELYLRCGRLAGAEAACAVGEAWARKLGARSSMGLAARIRGSLHGARGEAEAAGACFAEAVEIARSCAHPLMEAEALAEWALLHLAGDRHAEGLACLSDAHRIFSALGAQRALLDVDRRLDRLEEVYLRVVREWAEAIESKDRYTAGHCERVAGYACRLAEALGLSGRDLVWFRMGAYLHDVGKISIPDEVLNKPGKLDEAEWRQMRMHPVVGDELVAALRFPWNIRPMVRWHHERWDGGGYPDGLAGEAIPLHARILALADTYDALTVARSYQQAHTHQEALAIMASRSGTHFDPDLFRRFAEVVAGPSVALASAVASAAPAG